jgi:hypothetical protein
MMTIGLTPQTRGRDRVASLLSHVEAPLFERNRFRPRKSQKLVVTKRNYKPACDYAKDTA